MATQSNTPAWRVPWTEEIKAGRGNVDREGL